MAYGKHNDTYAPPKPKAVARPPVPKLSRTASTVGGGGKSAPTGVSPDVGHRSERLNVPQKFDAPSRPVNQPNKDYRP